MIDVGVFTGNGGTARAVYLSSPDELAALPQAPDSRYAEMSVAFVLAPFDYWVLKADGWYNRDGEAVSL